MNTNTAAGPAEAIGQAARGLLSDLDRRELQLREAIRHHQGQNNTARAALRSLLRLRRLAEQAAAVG